MQRLGYYYNSNQINMIQKRTKAPISGKLVIIIALVILLIGSCFVLYKYTNLFKNKKPLTTHTANSYTKGVNNKTKSNIGSNTNSGNSTTSSDNSLTNTLLAPTGNFVSNHRPNLSGSPAPNVLTSVCNTTPGAYCQISFSMNGITKDLPKEKTDSGGAAYWNNWSIQNIGLQVGSWKITAIATLSGQSKTASDPMLLVIKE